MRFASLLTAFVSPVLALAGSAQAQVLPDDLLLNITGATGGGAPGFNHYRPDGTLVFSVVTGAGARGADWARSGYYVTSTDGPSAAQILYFAPDGSPAGGFQVPQYYWDIKDLDVMDDGKVVVSGPPVWIFEPTGLLVATIQSTGSAGLYVDSAQNIWFCFFNIDGGAILKFDRQGVFLDQFFLPWYGVPLDLIVAPDETLWVTVWNDGVYHFAANNHLLEVLSSFPVTGGTPYGIAMSSDGTLWITGPPHDEVRHYEQDGTFLGRFLVPTAGQPWNLNVVEGNPLGSVFCSANPNSTGAGARLRALGASAVSANHVTFDATLLPPHQFGYLLISASQALIPVGQGTLCLGAPQIRFSGDVLDSGPTGWMNFRPDLTALPQGTVVLPGSTWNFQLWYRDANPGPVSNFTEGLEILFE